jgi:hypothetical protein
MIRSTCYFLGCPVSFSWVAQLVLDNDTSKVLSFFLPCVGQKLSFSYDKVFDHDASQEDVFVEISQLVQSALDGYKVLTLHGNMC